MTIYTPTKCSCVICKKEFSTKGIHTHYERAHGTQEQKEKYSDGHNGCYDSEEFRDNVRKGRGFVKKTVTKDCEWCKEKFTFTMLEGQKERRWCCRSCSASFTNDERVKNGYVAAASAANYWTVERRADQSAITKKLWEDPEYAKSVLTNNKYFTSKAEVMIREHFIKNFPDDGWTFGGGVKVEGHQISRDLYSKKLKICFEYDGVWHFKDIHGQLEKKQLKDRLLEQWCVDNGYSLVRLDEVKFNDSSLVMLENVFYSIQQPTIIKMGDRY
jgi:hypothetical protein